MCHFGKSVNHAHCATQSKCKRGHAHQNMVGPIEISQRPTAVTLLEIDFWISGQVCSFFYPDQAEAYTKAAMKYYANNRISIRLRGAAENRQEFKLSQRHDAAAATVFYFAKSR